MCNRVPGQCLRASPAVRTTQTQRSDRATTTTSSRSACQSLFASHLQFANVKLSPSRFVRVESHRTCSSRSRSAELASNTAYPYLHRQYHSLQRLGRALPRQLSTKIRLKRTSGVRRRAASITTSSQRPAFFLKRLSLRSNAISYGAVSAILTLAIKRPNDVLLSCTASSSCELAWSVLLRRCSKHSCSLIFLQITPSASLPSSPHI